MADVRATSKDDEKEGAGGGYTADGDVGIDEAFVPAFDDDAHEEDGEGVFNHEDGDDVGSFADDDPLQHLVSFGSRQVPRITLSDRFCTNLCEIIELCNAGDMCTSATAIDVEKTATIDRICHLSFPDPS